MFAVFKNSVQNGPCCVDQEPIAISYTISNELYSADVMDINVIERFLVRVHPDIMSAFGNYSLNNLKRFMGHLKL